jgi:acyl-coenzyme A thioesterase PaaI-like protein
MANPLSHSDEVARQIASIERVALATPPPPREFDRLGTALRDLSRWMLGAEDAATIKRAADVLEALAGELGVEAHEPTTRFTSALDENSDQRLVNAWGKHPLLGSTHPLAPHIDLRVEGDIVVGDVTFDVRFEGNFGWVHGGFVAAGFDIVAVQAARLSGRSGPTGTLTVRFVEPTPVGVPVRYEGRFVREEGRKLFVEGRLVRTDDGRATAEAQAIVVAVG